ncbi:MAG: T9SS type A sorting domain-containing protein [Flavobacterium sp.]|nr:T9SS type A sorting domain-containing protein [Flavobacterium sp.]
MKIIYYLFLLSFGILTAAPSVQVIPYPGVQDANTSSPAVYFKVIFSEVVTEFTNSDLVVGGTSGAAVGFINEQFISSFDGQNFMIQVDVGALNSGTVTLFIPAGAAFGGGDANTASNICTINYQIPATNCSSYNGLQFNPLQINFEYEKNIPIGSCENSLQVATYDIPVVNARYLRVNNYSANAVCTGVTIVRQAATSYPFYVVRSLQLTDINQLLTNFLGGSYTVNSLESLNAVGQAYKCVNFELEAGDVAYIIVLTQNTDYFMYLDGLDCNALSNDEIAFDSNIQVIPNPSNGVFQIEGVEFETAKVYNLTGQLLYETTQSILNVEHLAKGTYLLEISNGEHKKVEKIIID